MVAKSTFYGVVAVMISAVVLSSTLAATYYLSYQSEVSQNRSYANEINAALARADELSRSYNASLSDFNQTLTLLAAAVSDMNRSLPAYQAVSSELPALWAKYLALPSSNETQPVYGTSMEVNYGNGTKTWYNESRIQAGWNGYVATLYLLRNNVEATWYPQFGEHFVSSIGGVGSNSTASWFVWQWHDGSWSYSESLGIDLIPIGNGTVFAWTLWSYC